MVKLMSGGGAAHTSAGFVFTRDHQAVRHQQSLPRQTNHVRTGAYTPRRKRAAETEAQWRERLVREAPQTRAAIAGLDAALDRIEQTAQPTPPRPLSHQFGRALKWMGALPDGGNVKANREQAVRLTPKRPNVLRKPMPEALRRPAAVVVDQAGVDLHKQALTTAQRQRHIAGLLKEAEEMRDALRQQTPAAAPTALQAQLATTLARLSTAQQAATTAAADARVALREHERAVMRAAITALPGFNDVDQQSARASQLRARLLRAADALLDRPFDPEAQAMPAPLLMDLLLDALAETSHGDLAQLGLANANLADHQVAVTPPTALLDPPQAAALLAAVRTLPGGMLAAEQLSGQPLGAKLSDAGKTRRTALRVGALAGQALARWPATANADARARLSAAVATAATMAADAAAKVGAEATAKSLATAAATAVPGPAKDAADLAARNAAGAAKAMTIGAGRLEDQQAAYHAVRNGFLLGEAEDQDLLAVEERLDKLFGPWLERAAEPRRRAGPLLNKTPFDDTSMRLAANTATLGYDAAERPMKRLDETLRRVQTQLPAFVAHLRPGTLSVNDAVLLAAQLEVGRRAADDRAPRPGRIALAPGDAGALTARLTPPLRARIAGAPTDAELAIAVQELCDAGGMVADPLALAPLLRRIAGHVDPQDAAAVAAGVKLLKDAGIARDMTATAQTEHIGSSDDLFNFLRPMVQQLELRGKIKITSGGNVGGSSKLFTWPISLLKKAGLEVALPVRGELKGNYTRGAVFEIGFSTTGFEIFIGSEARHGRGGGGGVGVRAGWDRLASSGGGVDRTRTRDQARTGGVWLRLPRNSDDERTRDEALALLKTLFGKDGADAASGLSTRRVGNLLARHPNLSLSVVEKYSEDTVRNEAVVAGALLNVKTGDDDAGRFAFLNAGVKSERRDKGFKLRDKTGAMRMERSNQFSGGIAFAQAGVLTIGAGFDTGGAADAAPTLANGFTYARQLAEKGIDTKLRFITRDGETNAVDTRVDYENLDFANHRQRIDQDRRAWLDTGVRELFKPGTTPMPPLNERMRVAEHWLDTMLEQAAEQSAGNARHVYSLSYSLMKTAAGTVDGLRAKAELARRAGDGRGGAAIERQVDELLQHPASWQPWKITTSERTSEREQRGLNLGVVYGAATTAEGQRGTNSYPK